VVAVAVECTGSGVVTIGNTNEDPDEDNGEPSSKTVMAFEEAMIYLFVIVCTF
jgi:hypothetical protein